MTHGLYLYDHMLLFYISLYILFNSKYFDLPNSLNLMRGIVW
jgi:hypothetical protein